MTRNCFQKTFFLFALMVIWQCFPLVITQNSTLDAERYYTVSTDDSLNGSISTLMYQETTTEVMVTADSSSKVNLFTIVKTCMCAFLFIFLFAY